jgi:hypothetical protein
MAAETPLTTSIDATLRRDLRQLVKHGLIEVDEASDPNNPRVRPTAAGLQMYAEQEAQKFRACLDAFAAAQGDPLARVLEVVEMIERITGGEAGFGITNCPFCQGRLHYGRSPRHKRVTAYCETGCVKFVS